MEKILRHIAWMTAFVSWALLSAACGKGEGCMDEIQSDNRTATLFCVLPF
ncbi:hypothetical protein NXX38_20775 [Bacteroides sp. BFG-637]|nr:hypothetical protein [Bacteroides sp. BFG-637]MCS3314159.1 hypothetical protein [Bacteroides sp. BFG-637]